QLDIPGSAGTGIFGLNNQGQIVGSFSDTSGGHGFLATPDTPPAQAPQLFDPVPDLLNGSTVTTNPETLATRGRHVQGAAADGVTKVVLRIPASVVGAQYILTLLNDQGAPSTSTDTDGSLGNPGDTTFTKSTLTVQAKQTSQGPMAFTIYRAP